MAREKMSVEKLNAPIQIAPNLAAGVCVDGHWVTIEYSEKPPVRTNRTRFKYSVLFPDGTEESGDDLESGYGGANLSKGLETLLSFMSACGESRAYEQRTGEEGCNSKLFSDRVGEFCSQYQDELSILGIEIEETRLEGESL